MWPDEPFILVKSIGTCPDSFPAGLFRHQVENRFGNERGISSGLVMLFRAILSLSAQLDIESTKEFTTVNYCGKVTKTNFGIDWPPGSYCLARFRDSCPKGFYQGAIKWHDEDAGNTWGAQFPHPPFGDNGKKPNIQYCCRSDGDPNNPLFLPSTTPFAMYRHRGRCQEVRGMSVQDYVWKFHTEPYNENYCSGNHPDDDDCFGNHAVHYCTYTPHNYG